MCSRLPAGSRTLFSSSQRACARVYSSTPRWCGWFLLTFLSAAAVALRLYWPRTLASVCGVRIFEESQAISPRAVLGIPPWKPVAAATADCAWLNASETAVFVHTWPGYVWRMVTDDILSTLVASPLLACGVKAYVNFPGDKHWPYDGIVEGVLRAVPSDAWNAANRRFNEDATLASLVEWCAPRPNGVAIYVHDKGTRHPPDADLTKFFRQWDWRKLHEYFLLVKPQGCLHALAAGYDICGSNRIDEPLHYSGNFFAARCSHIKKLAQPWDPALVERFGDWLFVEFWLGSSNSRERPVRAFNCFSSHVHHTAHEYSRGHYVGASCDLDVESHNPWLHDH